MAARGKYVYVNFGEEPECWHEMLVLREAGSERPDFFCILTPDDDVYVEDLRVPENVVEVRWGTSRHNLPAGLGRIRGHPVYRFAAAVGSRRIQSLAEEAEAAVADFRQTEGLSRAPSSAPRVEEGKKFFVVISDVASLAVGMEVEPNFDDGDLQVGNFAMMKGAAGESGYTVAELMSEEERKSRFKKRADDLGKVGGKVAKSVDINDSDGDDDVRTLPVKYEKTGERFRSFEDVVAHSQEDAFEADDWPMEGPRTCLWWLKHVRKMGSSPLSRHNKWVAESGVLASDRSIYEHDIISQVLENLACVDQLNLPNLLGAELLVRRLQLIEDAHALNPTQPTYEGAEHYMGISQKRGGMLVDPKLSRHVAGKVKDEMEVSKERRKAREERKLAPKKNKKEGE